MTRAEATVPSEHDSRTTARRGPYGYVVVIEEADHEFPSGWDEKLHPTTGVRTRVLRGWA
jgi:hypothetical protein